MYDNDSHIEGKFSHSFEAPSVLDTDDKVKPCVGVKRGHICSASLRTSSAARNESSVDASTSEVFGLSIPDSSEGHPSDIISCCITGTITNANGAELPTSSSSESTADSVNRMSWSSELNKMKSSYSNEKFQSRLKVSKTQAVISDNVQPTILESRTIDGAALSEDLVKDVPKRRTMPSSSCSGSYSRSNDRGNDSQPLKGKEVRSVSVSSSSDHPLAATGRHSVSSAESAKSGSVHTLPSKIGSIPSLSQNAKKGLRTSVQKVVQQFRASKQSKPYLLGVGKDVAEKYNCKTVFPYKLFMQLYFHDMVELCPFGLVNCGNSCYANAVLQCLTFTRPLASYLLQGLHSKRCQKEWCFICEFEHLILKGKEGKFPLSPIGIISQIQKIGSHLGPGREEDAHEFLRCVVDTMQLVCLEEAGVVDPLAEESTLVGLTFGGYLRSKIKCMKCLGKSERFERIMDLTVEIDGDIETLEEALAQFTATETLDGDNKYWCSRCRSYEKAKKTLTIMEAPNILTIVLKRFQSGNFEKLNKLVCFPEVLNMAPYMSETSDKYPTYSLYAVVVHLDIMNAALSGHYVCYVKDFQGEWFKIDDSMVIPVDLETVLLERAYMLLYARHTPWAPSLSRNTSVLSDGKIKRNLEAVPSCNSRKKNNSKARSNTVDSSMLQPRLENYPYWMTLGGHTSNQFLDPEDWRFHLMRRVPTVDLSSDSSSIFSSSDTGSCSTESTGGSTSAEDITGYIFGDVSPSWYFPSEPSLD
ncbi:ubiquitin carboxyl-terminal hydrolase 17-like isoform X2 [Cornus florida]|nr:ubiquitin carboxyl-terminal hydrolase 17-like isoform X2 [Cornus florida]